MLIQIAASGREYTAELHRQEFQSTDGDAMVGARKRCLWLSVARAVVGLLP